MPFFYIRKAIFASDKTIAYLISKLTLIVMAAALNAYSLPEFLLHMTILKIFWKRVSASNRINRSIKWLSVNFRKGWVKCTGIGIPMTDRQLQWAEKWVEYGHWSSPLFSTDISKYRLGHQLGIIVIENSFVYAHDNFFDIYTLHPTIYAHIKCTVK